MDEVVLVGILAVTCAFICGVAAHSKGRDGLAWMIAGLFLGPFAVLAIMIASNDESGQRRHALEQGNMKKCPYCAEIIQMTATKCRYCQSEVPRNDDY